jgi:hypothetical protein
VTPTVLTAIASSIAATGTFLAGLGTLFLAVVAFIGLRKWKEQATFKDEFDLAKKVVEVTCRIESIIIDLESSEERVFSSENAIDKKDRYLPKLGLMIEELDSLAVSVEAVFTREEANQVRKVLFFSQRADYTFKWFYEAIIFYNEANESISKYKKDELEEKDKKNNLIKELIEVNSNNKYKPRVSKDQYEQFYRNIKINKENQTLMTEHEESIKKQKIIIDNKSNKIIYCYSDESEERKNSTFSDDLIPLSVPVRLSMQKHLKRK